MQKNVIDSTEKTVYYAQLWARKYKSKWDGQGHSTSLNMIHAELDKAFVSWTYDKLYESQGIACIERKKKKAAWYMNKA